jgi:hypothetical protein
MGSRQDTRHVFLGLWTEELHDRLEPVVANQAFQLGPFRSIPNDPAAKWDTLVAQPGASL